jgi:hypothetical protein
MALSAGEHDQPPVLIHELHAEMQPCATVGHARLCRLLSFVTSEVLDTAEQLKDLLGEVGWDACCS